MRNSGSRDQCAHVNAVATVNVNELKAPACMSYVSSRIAWGMTAPFLQRDIGVDDLPNLHGSVFEPPIICNHHALSEAPSSASVPWRVEAYGKDPVCLQLLLTMPSTQWQIVAVLPP